MDKSEILERIRQTLRELSSGQTIFVANTLHHIENVLANDVAAEKEAREAVVVNGQVVNWEASAKRYRAKCRQLRAERDAAREHIAKQNVRPPSDYSDLVTENARLRVALHAERGVVNAVTDALNVEREAHLQLQAEYRDPNVELLAAQFDAHREDIHDALSGHEYRLESLENRLAALKAI